MLEAKARAGNHPTGINVQVQNDHASKQDIRNLLKSQVRFNCFLGFVVPRNMPIGICMNVSGWMQNVSPGLVAFWDTCYSAVPIQEGDASFREGCFEFPCRGRPNGSNADRNSGAHCFHAESKKRVPSGSGASFAACPRTRGEGCVTELIMKIVVDELADVIAR